MNRLHVVTVKKKKKKKSSSLLSPHEAPVKHMQHYQNTYSEKSLLDIYQAT